MKKLLALFLVSQVCLANIFVPGGSINQPGVFDSPTITGTMTLFGGQTTVSDGGDRTIWKGNITEWRTTDDRVGLFLNIAGDHPQLTTIAMDQWFEAGTGGNEGSLAFLARTGRIGWSEYQQDELPGWRHPRDIGMSNGLHFVATSEAATETLTSDHARILYSGTKAAANQTLSVLGTDALIVKNTGNTRYIEQYLGASSIYKTQQNVDAWVNDARRVSYSSGANKKRTTTITLSSGTTGAIANVLVTANTKFSRGLVKVHSGTRCFDYKVVVVAATSYTVSGINADGSSCTTDNSTMDIDMVDEQT